MKKPLKSFWRRPSSPRPTSRSFFWHRRLIGRPGAAEPHAVPAAALDAPAPQAKAKLLERAWKWIHTTFPERQIYIRSDGRVQFFTFGPSLQATLAGLVLIFLGWVTFATVNVIFKDRIIAAKDHRFQQMQAAYETKVADLQVSYDELNAALVSAQDRFKATADALQTKQNAIAGFLNRASQVQTLAGIGDAPAAVPAATAPVRARENLNSAAPFDVDSSSLSPLDGASSSALTVLPGPAQPQPRTAAPVKSGLLENSWRRLASLPHWMRERLYTGPVRNLSRAYAQHPGLHRLAEQTARIVTIGKSENVLMTKTEGALDQSVGNLRNVVRRTGINPDSFDRKIAVNQGVGGPEIPLDQVRVEGISDPQFASAYLNAAAVLDQLNGLSAALDHVPLAAPVSAASFDRSSGFGARVDPFTRRYAFHPGIDFAGPWGSVVHATAPGIVVFAGYRGGYGNMVEIDHGYGIHTRYGHLSKIAVRLGAQIGKGAGLGRVGSTGRSTGPHVHYEVWYDDVVKNPNNFIEAGRNVL
jgi:murein DD-endopeptidase MepM/ murein hydrolase activator NlpD